MRCFLSYKTSENNLSTMKELMSSIRETLSSLGIDSYSILLDYVANDNDSGREFMDCAFSEIDKSDCLLVIQNDKERSEGMLMEVGYCIAKKIPVVIAKQDQVTDTYLPEMTEYAISWSTRDDLLKKLKTFNFNNLKSCL